MGAKGDLKLHDTIRREVFTPLPFQTSLTAELPEFELQRNAGNTSGSPHSSHRAWALQQHSERRDPSILASPPFNLLPTFILTNDHQKNTPYMGLKVSAGNKEASRQE